MGIWMCEAKELAMLSIKTNELHGLSGKAGTGAKPYKTLCRRVQKVYGAICNAAS